MKQTTFLRQAVARPLAVLLAFSLICAAVYPIQASAAEQAQLKTDISEASITVYDQSFNGGYIEPSVTVWINGKHLVKDTDFSLICENNTNIGTATVHIVGLGNYYGVVTKEFQITYGDNSIVGPLAFNGYANDELNDNVEYREVILPPGKLMVTNNHDVTHEAYYELYRIEGTKQTKIDTYETERGWHNETAYTYDFTSVYNKKNDLGMEVYVLAYALVDYYGRVYSGGCIFYVPTKVPDGTEMALFRAEKDGDFRSEYIGAYSTDGHLGKTAWSSCDESVATVAENGKVTFLKPGTVTITGTSGNLSASGNLVMPALDITQAEIYDYDAATGTAKVIYDGQLLIPGTDYTLSATTNGGVTDVVITGCGLFEGYIMRQFDIAGEPVDHTHIFDALCDDTCGSCSFTRVTQHSFPDRWSKDTTAHWHGCSVCGKQKDYAAHTLDPNDEELCTICGPLREPGDVDGNGAVNADDAVYLLLHTMFGQSLYPIAEGVNADFDGKQGTNADDAVYLLLHTMFGESLYPLSM